MSFEHAPVAKGLMMSLAVLSLFAGLFDVKHYLHLQLVPHISSQHQYWRLAAHHLAFSSSAELFMAELLLYQVGIRVERQFGSSKFASFIVVSALLATLCEFVALLLFHQHGLNVIASGPSALIFSTLYQYSRIVPASYKFRIFGLPLSNKSFLYFLALQLAISQLPGSAATSVIGILVGQAYRSDITNLKAYRIPTSVVSFSSRFLAPLVGSTRGPRRTNRALPESPDTTLNADEDVITTARPDSSNAARRPQTTAGTSVVREWVNELTGRADQPTVNIRTPTEAEIAQLTSMFPETSREAVVTALQRSPNIEGAVEALLRTPT